MTSSTIVAVATPPGRGGVSILRLSGPTAYTIATQLNGNKTLHPRVATFSSFFKHTNQLIDKGILLYFKAPHSFTGEDVIEIQAHGSPLVMDLLLKECLHLGAQLAKPGEFSERAFLNEKIDLTQAEAIADLIQASSETAASMAMRSLQGEFSQAIHIISDQIIQLRMYVEAAIDFPEEEIDFLSDGKVANKLVAILEALDILQGQANQGLIIREGMVLVIAGKPNAGKSTLLNKLAGSDVAIVTDIPGTTRDLLKSEILLDDIPLHIIDTAGLRESEDKVEIEGIKRTKQELKKSDCVLIVIDIEDLSQENILLKEINHLLPENTPIIVAMNKIDRLPIEKQIITINSSNESQQLLQKVYISAKEGTGIEQLKKAIKHCIGYKPNEGYFLARRRHLDALDSAKLSILTGQQQLREHKAGELLAEDLRLAHQVLGSIVGEFTSDDLLGKIFSSFCIGK